MSTRSYSSPTRERAAADTRAGILATALRLFEEAGYAGTSMAEIAAAAGVSVNTIYSSVGNKTQVLLALLSDASDDERIDASLDGARSERSPAESIAIVSAGTRAVFESHSWALGALYDNGASRPEFARAIEQAEARYRGRLDSVATHLDQTGGLLPGVGVERAGDILWFYFGFRPWRELHQSGWSWDDAQEWLALQATAALVGTAGWQPAAAHARAAG